MILLGLVEALTAMFFWLVGLLPDWSPPAAVGPGGAVQAAFGSLGSVGAGFAYWIPFDALTGALAVVAGAFVVACAAWGIRKVVSLVTLGKLS